MNPLHVMVAGLCLLGLSCGQEQATTLSSLAARAPVVVAATAVASTDPSPEFHRVAFRPLELLKGELPGASAGLFAVLEPAGRCCGRGLFALAPGDTRLLFLERQGPELHLLGGERGLVPGSPALLAHVRRLLASAPAAQVEVLAAALDHTEARIRGDAALALGAVPTLAGAGTVRVRVLAALRQELELGSTRVPALLDAVVRLGGATTAAELLPCYLAEDRADVRALLQQALVRLPVLAVLDAAQASPMPEATAPVRIAELLARMPDPANVPLLERLLAARPAPRTALAITEAMLAAGVPPASLEGRVPAPVFELAQRRRAALPRFATLRPRSSP